MQNRLSTTSVVALQEAVAKSTACRRFLVPLFLVLLCVSAVLTGFSPAASGADGPDVPAYGKGPRELIVFSDYFCPPCMTLESDLEPIINRLLVQGNVKVVFVDVPGHKHTALYARYFLYAVQGAPDYKNAMKARHVLFSLSKQNLAQKEEEIEKAFKDAGVSFKSFDAKPVYTEWNKIIKTHKVGTTPTCVMKYSATDVRKYDGSVEIRNKLLPEIEALDKKIKL